MTTTPLNKTDARRFVIGKPRKDGREKVCVNHHDGQLWASNGHWIVPADLLANLLPELRPGTWDADGNELDIEPPELAVLFDKAPAADHDALEPALCHGRPAIYDTGNGDCYLLEAPDGRPYAVNRTYLQVIREMGATEIRALPDDVQGVKCLAAYSTTRVTYQARPSEDVLTLAALLMPVRIS